MASFRIILLFFLLPVLGWSQTLVIKGIVREKHTMEPLPFCTISVPGTSYGVSADLDGNFQLVLDAVPRELVVVYLGKKQLFDLSRVNMALGQVLVYNLEFENEEPLCLCSKEVVIHSRTFTPAMDMVRQPTLTRGDLSSVEQGLNLVPGVKFESRGAGGSKRLAIRGGFLRSPFGVRDVKVYFAGAPLTSPDGSTPLELIDVQTISAAEVKKGPFSSEYGAVSNGVILFEPNYVTRIGRWGGSFNQSIGSFGYLRSALGMDQWTEHGGYALHYIHQTQHGYRDLEANAKDFFQANGFLNVKDHRFFLYGLAYQGNWGLPGALDSSQVAADPRQALPYSKTADAHVDRRHLRIGAGHRFVVSKLHSNTQLYLHLSDKENPYGTSPFFQGYKFERSMGGGGRTDGFVDITDHLGAYAGAEYQTERLDFKEFENVGGFPGAWRTASIIQSTQAHAYLGLREYFSRHYFHQNISINQVNYDQAVTWSAEALPDGKTDFPIAVAWSAQYGFNPFTTHIPTIFLRAATGYSPPALWELMDSTGGFNTQLKPETGLNLEARIVKSIKPRENKQLEAALNAYHHLLRDAIVPMTLTNGQTVYANQGKVRQMGLEAQVLFHRQYNRKRLSYIRLVANGAAQNFRFVDYALDGDEFKGKQVPGAPILTANLQADLETRWKTLFQFTANFIGRNYLNNANTVLQPAYVLLNAKVAHTLELLKNEHGSHRMQLTPYLGVNNFTNTAYTNFPQLNATNGKYWNPSPGVSLFGGAELRF